MFVLRKFLNRIIWNSLKRKLGQKYHLETIFPRTCLKIAIVALVKFLEPKGIDRTMLPMLIDSQLIGLANIVESRVLPCVYNMKINFFPNKVTSKVPQNLKKFIDFSQIFKIEEISLGENVDVCKLECYFNRYSNPLLTSRICIFESRWNKKVPEVSRKSFQCNICKH